MNVKKLSFLFLSVNLFGFVETTLVRKNSSKLVFLLTYLYLCSHESTEFDIAGLLYGMDSTDGGTGQCAGAL